MLNEEQIKAMRRGVNSALGLPRNHDLGHNFIDDFVVRPCKFVEGGLAHSDLLVTTYEGMCSWCGTYEYRRAGDIEHSKYRMTPKRYHILIGILGCLQAVLKVELFNEGGCLPEPPAQEDK